MVVEKLFESGREMGALMQPQVAYRKGTTTGSPMVLALIVQLVEKANG
jgi:hypothetical protein